MTRLTDRLKELLGPNRSDEGWCGTTRLANPWSVLYEGLRRTGQTPADTGEAGQDADAQGPRIPETDLRQAGAPRGEEGERQ
jgi:hypothetical protein